MINEILLILQIPLVFGALVLAFKFFGKSGVYVMSAVCTVLANIEVVVLVNAFGMEQTLGNILFAATFLATDILSECYGKKEADRAVNMGIFLSVFFILLTQCWVRYVPAETDFAMPSVITLFSNTPRLMLASILVYAVSQRLDVALYHKFWQLTEKHSGNRRGYMWLRNNAATLISQLVNTVLFNTAAFAGVHSMGTLVNIIISSYVIYLFTSLLDTPFLYIARKLAADRRAPDGQTEPQD